ncbi:hypothetical protein V6N11_009536 [Hibiscus sabdariffa]|uniref:RNase H type-1 domain-containing protein n=1 Tax=Hibiscus sabdariffa TaxID=183260 RepID=A0ABR2P5Z2_9ROSI
MKGEAGGVLLLACGCSTCMVTPWKARSNALALVRNIASLLQRPWLINLVLIRREANFVVDFIAKLPTTDDGSVRYFNEPYVNIVPILYRDLHSPAYPRY